MSRPASIFICHASADVTAAQALVAALEAAGAPCWISSRDVAPGENFQEAIVRALRAARALVFLLTPASNISAEVRKELALAGSFAIPVLPVRSGAVEPAEALRYELATRQWIDASTDPASTAHRLLDALPAAAAPPGPALPPVAEKPSLVVLPFQNMSGDVEQEYFVDGMVEDITTALSRIGGLFVIARNSAFTYKGRAVNVQQVGRDLAVRYVLEGSVRKSGNRVRITCQLIDATTAAHVWAERFDAVLDDIFELQDRVTESIAGAIEPNLWKAEIARALAKPTGNLTAYDLYLQAQAAAQTRARSGLEAALHLIRQAIAADPSFALAAAFGASVISRMLFSGWIDRDNELVAEGATLARNALAKARDDATTLAYASYITGLDPAHSLEIGRQAALRAYALNPNSALAAARAGSARFSAGDPREALRLYDRAIHLSPLDPDLPATLSNKAGALIALGEYEAALAACRSSRALHEVPLYGWVPDVIALVQLGRLDEARHIVDNVRTTHPAETVSRILRRFMAYPENRKEMAAQALRAAGLPE